MSLSPIARYATTPLRTQLRLDRRLLLGLTGGAALGPRTAVGQLTARVLQMGTDEPLELLQLSGVADEQVLRHQVEVLESADALAVVLDHAGVDQVECAQVRLHGVTADGVVVPGAVLDDRAGRALR